ncbi:MAG TPA: hypothetical protein VGM17_15630 [Rhizomicrobium sp.]|jgi:archaellum biogenesis protein FlaJ (TadC family)
MLERIFPKTFDNTYRGHWAGLVIFVLVVAVKALQCVETIFNTRNTAINADGIPIASFTPAGANTVLSMFALLGLYLLVIPAQSIVVLLRYRSMVPFLYFWLLLLQIAGRALHMLHPVFASDNHGPQPIGFYVNLGILAVTVLGFALSLVGPRYTTKGS